MNAQNNANKGEIAIIIHIYQILTTNTIAIAISGKTSKIPVVALRINSKNVA